MIPLEQRFTAAFVRSKHLKALVNDLSLEQQRIAIERVAAYDERQTVLTIAQGAQSNDECSVFKEVEVKTILSARKTAPE